jgi:hypothetical protein
MPLVDLAAAALGFHHADAAVRPDEAEREQQRAQRLAGAGLAVDAEEQLRR